MWCAGMGCDALLVVCGEEPPRVDAGWYALARCKPLCDYVRLAPEAEVRVLNLPEGARVDPRLYTEYDVVVVGDRVAWGWWLVVLAGSRVVRRSAERVRVGGVEAVAERRVVRLCRLCPLSGVASGMLAPPCSPRVNIYYDVAPFLHEPVVRVSELLSKSDEELLASPEEAEEQCGDDEECRRVLAERREEIARWLRALREVYRMLPDELKEKLYVVKWC